MSFHCEISGELLSSSSDEVVVTPSGHVCLRRLLLAKLAENGSVDPFVKEDNRPLLEDQLVVLRTPGSPGTPPIVPPRPNSVSSVPGLLRSMQNEYDALVLELFDTRKLLEETRRELSQALYQNDAAIRVVARMAMERDEARQKLQAWTAAGNNGGGTAVVPMDVADPSPEPQNKKRKIEGSNTKEASPLVNDIPQEDLDSMIAVWENLHKNRKALCKEAAAAAPTADDLAAYKLTATETWHETTCKGVTAISLSEDGKTIATSGKDKKIIAYDVDAKKILFSVSADKAPTSVQITDKILASVTGSGKLQVWSVSDGGNPIGDLAVGSTTLVNVQIHPDGEHIFVASESGRITIARSSAASGEGVQAVAVLKDEHEGKYTSGALHPDGLIYLAGNAFGEIVIWDIKSRSMAGTLKEANEGETGLDAVTDVEVSPNGYHIAASYASGRVRVWDLRKQKCVATLNQNKDMETVSSVAFDQSGKYVSYSGPGGIAVVTVKEWEKVTMRLDAQLASGFVWGKRWIAAYSSQQRKIGFYEGKS